jgi:hypothetical protein
MDGHEGVALEDTQPYIFQVPSNVPDGVIDIEVRASNDLQSTSTTTITVTKGSPCTSADSCAGGQQCEEGRCFWPTPVAELGEACVRDQDCISAVCANTSGGKLCSQECSEFIADSCPAGFACESTEVCAPVSDGGGCNAGGGMALGQIVGLLVIVISLRIRRREYATSSGTRMPHGDKVGP